MKDYKKIHPKFIKESKIKQIEKLIELKYNTKLKETDEDNFLYTILTHWLANVKRTKEPDPDLLFKQYNDLLLNVFSNEEHKKVWIDEYKEV